MRALILAFAALLLIAQPAAAQRAYPQPKLYAIYFYADWCPNCKALSPIVAESLKDFDKETLFLTFDLTDKPRIRNTILHAQALGLGDYLRAQGSATGYLAVLDAKTKKEVARFDRDDSAKDISATLKKLATSS